MALGKDHYLDVQSSFSAILTSPTMITTLACSMDQIEWIGYNIFEGLDFLKFLSLYGNSTAIWGREVLMKLCQVRPELSLLYTRRYHLHGSKQSRLVVLPAPKSRSSPSIPSKQNEASSLGNTNAGSSQAQGQLTPDFSATNLFSDFLKEHPYIPYGDVQMHA